MGVGMYKFENKSNVFIGYDNEIYCFKKEEYETVKDKFGFESLEGCRYQMKRAVYDEKTILYCKIFDLEIMNAGYIKRLMKENAVSSIMIECFDIILGITETGIQLETICDYYGMAIDCRVKKYMDKNKKTVYFRDQQEEIEHAIKQLMTEHRKKDEVAYYDKLKHKFIKNKLFYTLGRRDFSRNRIDMNEKIVPSKRDEKIEISVGRFSPILAVERIDNIDICNIPVYKGIINGEESAFLATQGGKGITEVQAYNSAVGECVERFLSQILKTDIYTVASFDQLNNSSKVLDPRKMNIDTLGGKLSTFDENKEYRWIKAINLKDHMEYYVEASFVFFPYEGINKNDLFHAQSTTGLACGQSQKEAVLGAILEIVERNAYSIAHKTKEKSCTIDNSVLDQRNKALIGWLGQKNILCHLVLLNSQESAYIVHCTTEAENKEYPVYTHGCAAALDINTAILKAILECMQLRISQLELLNSDAYGNYENTAYREWGEGNKDYCEMFLREYQAEHEVIASGMCDNYANESIEEDIEELVKNIDDEYVLAVDLSVNNCELKVVRVIIPSYQDIDNTNTRVTKRLRDKLGISPINSKMIFS